MIYNEINEHDFAKWVASSDSYKNKFSWAGANALQEYLEELSNDIDENISFDPIAWCCEFSEYKDFDDWSQNGIDIKDLDELKDNTTVIEFDGGMIVQDF